MTYDAEHVFRYFCPHTHLFWGRVGSNLCIVVNIWISRVSLCLCVCSVCACVYLLSRTFIPHGGHASTTAGKRQSSSITRGPSCFPPVTAATSSHPDPSPAPRAETICWFSMSKIPSFKKLCIHRILQCSHFCDWYYSLPIFLHRLIDHVICINSIFDGYSVVMCTNVCSTITPERQLTCCQFRAIPCQGAIMN